MPVIRINAIGDRPVLHGSPQAPTKLLQQAQGGAGPVIVMTHGCKYQPGHARHCPHEAVLALPHDRRGAAIAAWPEKLGFGQGNPDEGLAIAFGWDGFGGLWQARQRAIAAGRAMAAIIRHLRQIAPHRPVHFIGHSMGVELALEALHHLPPGALSRIISLTGAAYRQRARAALQTEAGHAASFINVTSRENDLFDFLFECLIAPPECGDRALGLGLEAHNAVTLQLDCRRTLEHLSRFAGPVGGPERRICHWSSYRRPGALAFYNALLRAPEGFDLSLLRMGLPATSAPRWSRLLSLPQPQFSLPFTQKAS
ncbi:alpha/beta hydrolase [Ruegeria sp. 2205SS24-7]|uniref:alpha/beta hydrolase n=1 Tax=Ruegeria discodermiae TaxID=3064389 RepID=UPI002740F9BE|nr:alpha/beta hydrolase [Ruegeria sp. 2205SS24-7]MDP5216784.1 alpha/beta hydrolase [Ruegeria sp. 2205SS24-7]